HSPGRAATAATRARSAPGRAETASTRAGSAPGRAETASTRAGSAPTRAAIHKGDLHTGYPCKTQTKQHSKPNSIVGKTSERATFSTLSYNPTRFKKTPLILAEANKGSSFFNNHLSTTPSLFRYWLFLHFALIICRP